MSFKEMWIPCTEQEYPEVKALLEGMEYYTYKDAFFSILSTGVCTYDDGSFAPRSQKRTNVPTVNIDELRAMALPKSKVTKEQIIETLHKCAKITQDEGGVKIERYFEREAEAIIELFNQSK